MITDRSLLEERGGRGEEEGRRRRRGRRSRRDADGIQTGRRRDARRKRRRQGQTGAGAVGFGLIDSCAYSSIVSYFSADYKFLIFPIFGFRLSLLRRGSDS